MTEVNNNDIDMNDKVLVTQPRSHELFKKYNDHSIKPMSTPMVTISEIIVLVDISNNPQLFLRKLRYMIEVMPDQYWCEKVTLDDYIRDIDMVELPNRGISKRTILQINQDILC